MDTYEQHTVTRLRSLLHLVFSSRSIPTELYSWCQTAFPGCCYLSCATLTADNSFATTSNLVAWGSLQVGLQSVQQGQATHGAVLHNSWPLQYPDLQQLREASHWDIVIVTGVPEIPAIAASPASASPQANGLAHSPTSSRESLIDAQADSHTPTSEVGQADVSDCAAQSMLILGLRGQNHDLERTLDSLRMLSHQLTPVMHRFRQQLIDQAWHAANTAATAADRAADTAADTAARAADTAANSGDGASTDSINADPATDYVISATAQQQPPANSPDSAFHPPLGNPTPHMVSSPFAMSEAGAVGPFLPLGGVTTRQGRRREISGSLPLEQMLSRLPSPVGSAAVLDRGSSDGAASNRHASRLSSSSDLSQLALPAPSQPPTLPPDPAADPTTAHHQTQDRWSLDSLTQRRASRLGSTEIPREDFVPEQSQVPATNPQGVSPPQLSRRIQATAAAAVGANLGLCETAHPLTTVYSGQGLLLASAPTGPLAPESSALPDAAAPSVSHEGGVTPRLLHGIRGSIAASPGSSNPADYPDCNRPTPQRGGGQAVDQDQGAVGLGGKVAAQSYGLAEDGVLVTQLHAEEDARTEGQQRQHPWLLYFYDGVTERDYRKYHAKQMAKVDAFSWGIGLIIYLILGFSGGHAYASRVPFTFAVVLGLHLACLYATVFLQDRVSPVRDQVVRLGGLAYLALQSFAATPSVLQSASIAQIHGLSFLARYSNTSTMVTTSLGFMVRLHIHLPCQLVSFAMSAAVLPKALCRTGFPEHAPGKCIAVGVSTQFLVGVVFSTAVVALNERRLRAMYSRSIAAQRAAATKAKAA